METTDTASGGIADIRITAGPKEGGPNKWGIRGDEEEEEENETVGKGEGRFGERRGEASRVSPKGEW